MARIKFNRHISLLHKGGMKTASNAGKDIHKATQGT
jgi:hypothetical protein